MNKSGKYIANQIKQNKEKTAIPIIMNSAGKLVQIPEEINKTFQDFYSNLYSSIRRPSQMKIDRFLHNIDLPKLTDDQVNELEKLFTIEEFHKALKPNNKSPGTDGFP